ncbi:MAG: DNA mismatch repair protein MutS [Gammaproteobacteria bacterium SG8_47]|nr:MAG: DNA mismatch repair protein MutS [Gammaproteobacteria bacterium SG8_47]
MADESEDLSDEQCLFRAAMADVRRLEHDGVELEPKRPDAEPRQTYADQMRVLTDMMSDEFDHAEVETGDELLHVRPGLQHTLVRKLRRGQLSIGAQLDLHGMIVSEAKQAVAQFLRDSQERGLRCVRIIHGKGLGSPNKQPVLKAKLSHWLRQRDDVLAFCSARPVDGGSGAVYVLLRAR